MASENPAPKERWGSRIGVILAVAGSAVGLGNFLRFPGQAAQNGGGAFMLPYFISLLVLGIPLCWAEWTMGRYGGLRGFNSAPGIYSTIWRNRLAKYLGAIALLLPLIIYMYYVLIEAWCLGYALNYLNGNLVSGQYAAGADSSVYGEFFATFTGQKADGALVDPQGGQFKWVFVLLAVFSLNFVLIYRGVTKGIEKFCRVAMPIMIVLALIVLARVLTLDGIGGGLNFMWNPDASALTNPKTWLAAAGQVFFSLSVGFGIIINYSSYMTRDDDVVLSGLTSSSMNEFFEVCLGGLITIPAAFIFLGVAVGTQGTFDLGFVAMPNVFAQMPAGQVVGFLWFFMLFLAAITSSVSMLQPVIAFLEEAFGLKRHASAAILGLITLMGCCFVMFFSKGLVALDTMDFWVGTFLIFVLAMIQAVLYGWVLGIERGEKEAHTGAHMRIPKFVQYMLKYVTPTYLGIVFIAFIFNNLLSTNTSLFEIEQGSVAISAELTELPQPIVEQLKSKEKTVPEVIRLTTEGDNRWAVRAPDKGWIYTLEQTGDKWDVQEHKAQYIEKVTQSQSATLAVGLILAVLAFLLILISIAGRRWEKQGKLTYGSEPLPELETKDEVQS